MSDLQDIPESSNNHIMTVDDVKDVMLDMAEKADERFMPADAHIGHIIKDAEGTSYTHRDSLKFQNTLRVADNSSGGATEISVNEFIGTMEEIEEALENEEIPEGATVYITDDNGECGGGGGGLTVIDDEDNEYTGVRTIKFVGLTVTQDEEDEHTVNVSVLLDQDFELSDDEIEVTSLESEVVTVDITKGDLASTFSAVSSDTDIVTVSVSGNEITLTAVDDGEATITVTMHSDLAIYDDCVKTIDVTSVTAADAVVGTTYTLGGDTHTGGSAIPQAYCLAVDSTNNKALMQSTGLYGSGWPGEGELSSACSSYFGDLASAISNVYLPKGSSANAETVYWNGSQTNAYASTVHSLLETAAGNYASFGATTYRAWLGTPYNSGFAYSVLSNGNVEGGNTISSLIVAPCFTIDLTKIKIEEDTITIKSQYINA